MTSLPESPDLSETRQEIMPEWIGRRIASAREGAAYADRNGMTVMEEDALLVWMADENDRLQSALTAARALEAAASSALLAFETPAVTEVGQREQREAWNALGEAIAEFRSRSLEGQRDA